MTGSQVHKIPGEALYLCNNLRSLNMANVGLSDWPLPADQGVMVHLLELTLRQNPFRSIPRGAFECCPALRSLDLSSINAVGRAPGGCCPVPICF